MVTRTITVGHVIAVVCWLGAIALGTWSALDPAVQFGPLGVVAAAAAGTVHIRCWIAHMEARTREWYELGRATAQQRPRGV